MIHILFDSLANGLVVEKKAREPGRRTNHVAMSSEVDRENSAALSTLYLGRKALWITNIHEYKKQRPLSNANVKSA